MKLLSVALFYLLASSSSSSALAWESDQFRNDGVGHNDGASSLFAGNMSEDKARFLAVVGRASGDDESSAGGSGGGGNGLGVATESTQNLLGGGGHDPRGSAVSMAEVAVNGGGISGGNNGGEERWGYGLGLAKEDESGLATTTSMGAVVGGTRGWKGDSEDVSGVSSVAGREDAMDANIIYQLEGGSSSGVFMGVSWRDGSLSEEDQFLFGDSGEYCGGYSRGVTVSAEARSFDKLHDSQKSVAVEDDTIGGGEVESGGDGLEHSESFKFNWIQKILSSARMDCISGPLLIQSSILFDDLGTSTNKGGVVDDGVESEGKVVIVRDEDEVSIHFTMDEDKSADVSKPEVNKDGLLNLKVKVPGDGQEVDSSVPLQDTVDVLSDTSIKVLEAKDMSRKSDCPNFLVGFAVLIFVMVIALASFLLPLRLRSILVVDLNEVRARILYDRGCKTLTAVRKSVVSNLLYPKLNDGRGKGKSRGHGKGRCRSKAKQRAALPHLKGYHSLLVLMVIMSVFCVLGSREAAWYSHTNDSEAAEGVNDLLHDGVVEGVSIETDLVSGSSSGQYTAVDLSATSKMVQLQQVQDQVDTVVESESVSLQDDGLSSELQRQHGELISFQNEMAEVRSELIQLTSDEASSDQDVLKATSKAMSLVKDRINDLQLSGSMPSHLQRILETTSNQITNAEKHMRIVEGLVSQYRGIDGLLEINRVEASKSSTNHRKLLPRNQDSSNQGRSSKKYHFNSGVSKADYHHRAKSRHLGQGQGFHAFLGNQFGQLGQHASHQQGYRNERLSREEGTTTHRRLQDDTNVCLPASRDDRKIEQCYRLAECARNYGLYDMFAIFFVDDFDFDTGVVGDDKIEVNDEVQMREKLNTVLDYSSEILEQYTDESGGGGIDDRVLPLTGSSTILRTEEECEGSSDPLCGKCDKLLQQFHRVDEGIGMDGKWAGVGVTGVCRGWGSTKFVSLESIYDITAENLNGKAQVEVCLQNEVSNFNFRSRNNMNELLSTPSWCDGSNLFRINTTSYCAQSLLANHTDLQNCQHITDTDCKIDPSIVTLELPPGNICEEELNADKLFQDEDVTKAEAQEDINAAFKCLYYSAFVNSYDGGDVLDGVEGETTCNYLYTLDQREECKQACYERIYPIFEVRGNLMATNINRNRHFEYRVPASLPPPEERLGRDSTGQSTGATSLGIFKFDIALAATDETAAEFAVEVFLEFMNCATNLVTELAPNNKIFSNNGGTNPYAPDDDNQFKLPLGILGTATDVHGQPLGKFLDQLIDYKPVSTGDGIEVCGSGRSDCEQGSLVFSDALRKLFIDTFVYNSIEEKIGLYQECMDDTTTQLQTFNCNDYNGVDDCKDFNPEHHYPLGRCEGDCDFDDQCDGGLKCFQRSTNGPAPPGCGGAPKDEYDYCYDPFCELQLDRLLKAQEGMSDAGIASSNLDDSIALLLGSGTTIGQTCSYAKGIELKTVETVPGFCCLDAPYEAQDWGETYTCLKYMPNLSVDALPGSTIVVQKDATDCNNLGPVTAGFNQAACDTYSGQWCPNPRDCAELALCIKNEIEEIENKETRPAFLQYLKDAPEVNVAEGESSDPTKCGDLREYFEYDRDYADDDRICEEVKDLKCLTDFSNLDSLVTGVPGSNDDVNNDVQLAISNTILAPIDTAAGSDSVNACSEQTSKQIRTVIQTGQKVIQALQFLIEGLDDEKSLCDLIPIITTPFGPVNLPTVFCKVPIATLKIVMEITLEALSIASDIEERLYSELCTPADDKIETVYQELRQDAIYSNVIANARNTITIFAATQQLKVMLGDVQAGLEADREERDDQRRRLLQSFPCTYTEYLVLPGCTCVVTTGGFQPAPCSTISCQDENRLCDGSYNYPLISGLITAGCDDMDSDGDREVDVCEDRFPPNILARDAKIFRCDKFDTSKLCYTDKWFKDEMELLNFLEYEFPAADDCAPSTKLSVTIKYDRGLCQNTVYKLEPFQDYPECNNRTDIGPFNLTFQNPLNGTAREVTVQLDEVAPVVECGFLAPNANMMVDGDGKTLYHYMLKTEGGGSKKIYHQNDVRLKDSGFFYKVIDNCNADVHIDIVVESNELQQNTVAQLFKSKRAGFVDQAKFLYAPAHCDSEKKKKVDGFCKEDPSMGVLKTRYYDITVTASDSAGNIGSDTCRVVIVPSCNPKKDSDCVEYGGPKLPYVEDFYYSTDAVNASVTQSKVLNQVAQQNLVRESGLASLDPNVVMMMIEEAVDIDVDPPAVTCSLGTQGLTGTGAGVFKDLGFSFTAVDGGKKSTDTKDLEVSIEVLSNEVVASGDDMVILSEPHGAAGQKVPSIWAEDHTCKSKTSKKRNNGMCKVSSHKTLREYVVRVTATDESGNSDMVQCNTIVGGKKGDTALDDPLFLITRLDITGGVEPEEDQDSTLFQ